MLSGCCLDPFSCFVSLCYINAKKIRHDTVHIFPKGIQAKARNLSFQPCCSTASIGHSAGERLSCSIKVNPMNPLVIFICYFSFLHCEYILHPIHFFAVKQKCFSVSHFTTNLIFYNFLKFVSVYKMPLVHLVLIAFVS